MKKFLVFLTLSYTFIFPVDAQVKYDYNSIFGYDNDLGMSGIDGISLDFNESPVLVSNKDILFEIYLSNATISDADGELLFYTNGCEIANKNHEMMINGDSLNPGQFHNSHCAFGYPGQSQSCIIIPAPDNPNLYYLFHKSINTHPDLFLISDRLYYTLIDMSLDDGLGEVIEKNLLLKEDIIQPGEMTAIKHSNGIDWWLINGLEEKDEYFTFLLTSEGLEGPFSQNIGIPTNHQGSGGGQVCFSPDGTKFARYNLVDHLFLYDFDRNTGLLSNFEQIIIDDTIQTGGCAFSSNSQFLYASTGGRLFQFDVTADDVKASQEFISEFSGCIDPFPANYYQMQLTPDCRILMNSTNGVGKLHVINHPNRKGMECEFEECGIDLPSYHQASMPHFPYYRMDTDYPICDSSLVVSSTEVFRAPEKAELKVYPNPASEWVTVEFGQRLKSNSHLKIYNMLGQLLHTEKVNEGILQLDLSLENLQNGLYLLQIEKDNLPPETITIKVVK